jgi:hexosaminidase
MTRRIALAARHLAWLAAAGVWLFAAAPAAAATPPLMPLPRTVTMTGATVPLTGPFAPHLSGCGTAPLDAAEHRLQADVARLTGVIDGFGKSVPLTITCRNAASTIAPMTGEGYHLIVADAGVRIDADGPTGALRAFATLRQLVTLAGRAPALRATRIDDAPRFAWRGIMLDTARHFITIPTIERQIDAMERMKFNVLHLHLSDDQAFRVESRRYPKLTTANADGHFYTQAQVRALVAYAAERGVLIVPEFDMPGHTSAIARAYPALGIAAKQELVAGLPNVTLNPALPATYRFVNGLVDEMAALFPGHYFHVGGDEVSDSAWADNPGVQALMVREHLADKAAVQGYFEKRVVAAVIKAGKTPIGWEEIMDAPIPRDAVVQAWQTSNATARSTAAGHPTIVSAGYYLDLLMPAAFHYAIDPLDPSAAGFTPAEAERIRAINPILAKILTDALVAKPLPPLTADERQLVMGAEAPMWGELVTDEMIDHRLWPRAAALAERFWSPAEVRDVDDMYRRLAIVQDQLTVEGLDDRANRMRMALRLSPGDVAPVLTLLDAVGPIRNMAHDHRILAALSGKMVVQPLNALADAAPVDSLVARSFNTKARRFAAGDRLVEPELRAQLAVWRDNDARFAAAAKGNAMLEPALPVSADLKALAEAGLQALDTIDHHVPLANSDVAAAQSLVAATLQTEAATDKPLLSFLAPRPPADMVITLGSGIQTLLHTATAR